MVPVAQIVGSVGRCEELDARFQPLKLTRLRQQRLENIRRLMDEGASLPPVELYKIKDEYFVIDGNHRVAVAKENGQTYIDAHVLEFLPDGERAEDRLYLEYHAFATDTGLHQIRLSQLGGYDRLRREIQEHQQALSARVGSAVTLKEAAQDWYRQVFQPVAQAIADRRLPQRLPRRTVGDLYLDLAVQRAYGREQKRELSWEETIARLAAQHPLPTRRERLAGAWHEAIGNLEAWWHGLRGQEPPCAFALQGPNGTIYCRRAGRATRFTTETRRTQSSS